MPARLVGVASLCVCLIAANAALGDVQALDLQPIRERIAASLQTLPPTSPLRARYQKLDTLLRKPDVPGLADDFAKLGRVARECAGKLAVDAALVEAASDALTSGITAIVDAEATAAAAVAEIPDAARRRKKSAAILRARRQVTAARVARDRGKDATACRNLGRAAKLFAATTKAAAKLAAAARRTSKWNVVLRDRSAELISVWTSRESPPTVYAVGAADDEGPTFLRGGAEGFARVRVPVVGDFWWVQEVPGAGIWAVGTNGIVVRYDPASGRVDDVSTGSDATLFGLWGSGPTDVWTVGGGPSGGALLHFDGTVWKPVAFPSDVTGFPYKIEGRASNELYACGTEGLLMRWNGLNWASIPSGTGTTLLTIAFGGPNASMGIAVGEVFAAEIIERAPDGTWGPVVLPDGVPSVAGVSIAETGDAWASGYKATVLHRVKGNWDLVAGVPFGPNDRVDLHTVSVDVEGGVWFAGGDITNHGNGTLLYYGPRSLPSEASAVYPQAPWTSVQPLLTATCAVVTCHAPPIAEGEMDLSTPALVATSLQRIPSTESPLLRVLPGKPSASYLWHKLQGTQESVGGSGVQMPKEGSLTPEQVDAIRSWIVEGAPTG